ncbi:alpha-glucosidase-like protein maltase [Neohortaea acidophila]|uniref:Alpha-glucosidase-like protein maltase n=1 Tax=Neohortaea acidophila TaxID=245834 RepID=A0A6A6PXA1_9PEZI|nr:alpha-glucosidase-like protein maltase [Neohortaea acidophila]KAF2484329.1 alpha-glucosidase-like protein maltase [Neohortaea acidophila]
MAQRTYSDPKWWKEAVVYQVYPASFLSTGSGSIPGWGDIKGITRKVSYLKDLGVDIIWLSPVCKSPQADMGYDISDYTDIDPRYGSLDDIDELIATLKSRGMKLMMDLVVNHTSDQHAWFLDSKSSKTADKRDWYIWQPAKYDADGNRQPPNNWAQILGDANSAWTWDEHTQEYYLSLFTPEQPDLNWRNPQVREAVHDVLRFWLDRGINGFRMDVINVISKVEGYPDAPVQDKSAKWQPGFMHFANGPHLHEYLREMRRKVLASYDTVTVGEMPWVNDEEEIVKVVGAESEELNMIFIFELMDMDSDTRKLSIGPWKPADLRRIVSKWQTVMYEKNGWNSIFIENHDNARSVSRFVDDSKQFRELGAKLLCLLATSLGGTLYVYQGQELGMKNVPESWEIEEYLDVETRNFWEAMQALHIGDESALQEDKKIVSRKARDHARTPVQWTSQPNAGFCEEGTKPWMRVNDDYLKWNARSQLANMEGQSVVQFWRHALQRRKNFKDAFVYGAFECLDNEHESVFAFKRTSAENDNLWMVVLNFSANELQWNLPKGLQVHGFIESNYGDAPIEPKDGKVRLRAWEGVLGRCFVE